VEPGWLSGTNALGDAVAVWSGANDNDHPMNWPAAMSRFDVYLRRTPGQAEAPRGGTRLEPELKASWSQLNDLRRLSND
jgi:hypothetical protein